MERAGFVAKFSKRLNASLHKAGYASTRSKAGVEIRQLAKVAEVSYQMARKYILGMALPDYYIMSKIAKWLNVSPGWLLFGEKELIVPEIKPSSAIEIDLDLLKYILNKCVTLFAPTNNSEKIANYIAEVIYDTSHIAADTKTIIKFIDMMLSSAVQFADIRLEKRA